MVSAYTFFAAVVISRTCENRREKACRSIEDFNGFTAKLVSIVGVFCT